MRTKVFLDVLGPEGRVLGVVEQDVGKANPKRGIIQLKQALNRISETSVSLGESEDDMRSARFWENVEQYVLHFKAACHRRQRQPLFLLLGNDAISIVIKVRDKRRAASY